jgi:hypothetical protein
MRTEPILQCHILLLVSFSMGAQSWNWNPEDSHPCNIPRRMTRQGILEVFGSSGIPPLFPDPIVITADDASNASQNDSFRNMTTKDDLLRFFGTDFEVTLSSSNSLSERRRTVLLSQYLDEIMTARETTPDQLSNESWYLFGETYSDEWIELLDHYDLPPCYTCTGEWAVALAFGIGNRGSGVQWHTHGPGFSEAIHGRKHWILYPPKKPPDFHKDQSSRQWMETTYWTADPKPMECTLEPGDLIYFPDRWWHATINLDPYTVFVSSFTTEHDITMTDEL